MLEQLLYPETVAVIGASRTPGKVGHEVVANLIKSGFKGTIVPINPSADEILGLKCYPEIGHYEGSVNLTVITVPTAMVYDAANSAIRAGTKAMAVITAGFKEVNQEGARLEREVAELCRANRVKMLGPNCLGLINTDNGMNATFAKHHPSKGGISVISQSGALCTAILDWANERKLGLAKMVSIGNKADLDENDFLRAFSQDEQTKVIVVYLESITSGEEFIKAASEAASNKPVMVLKAGITEAGAKAASSHTGSLSGADVAYGAAFKRAGVIRADTFENLLDYATAFSMQQLPQGNRVAIITNAGGPGAMAADAVENCGLKVTRLGQAASDELKKSLPTAASVANPIDVLGDASPDRYAKAIQVAQKDDSVDATVVILTPQAMTKPAETALQIAQSHEASGSKPILAAFMGGSDVMPARAKLVEYNLPDFPSPERAVNALRAMVEYATWRNRPPRIVQRFPVNRRRVERIISRNSRMNSTQLSEPDAKEILTAYGFSAPEGSFAVDAEEAVDIAMRIGLPVAMKIVSPDIVHKSDIGGVKLNLISPDLVRDAYDLMMMRVRQRAPNADLSGVYVEQMVPRGREVIIGMTRDPQFGPMLMFGLGGIFVEVMKDVTFHLAPITAEEAMQMLEGTRSYALLKGTRGMEAVDMQSIATALQRMSQLVTDFPLIMEMDINPLIVREVGKESLAADARITLSKESH
ncbi:MAG: acetate--CoA ligase family protein [Candidatus Alcyoniella australis]|nr:acetate--CoA ligase family protein [Candidatus Alcyoniella australis]